MRHRSVEYTIKIGITRDKWRVSVYAEEGVTIERTVKGSREKAEEAAKRTISNLLGEAGG